jgi:hypothetical protein
MNDSISTPGMGAMGIVRALTGGPALGKGSGNKKARKKLKKKINSNKKKATRRK